MGTISISKPSMIIIRFSSAPIGLRLLLINTLLTEKNEKKAQNVCPLRVVIRSAHSMDRIVEQNSQLERFVHPVFG
jgi:hypothetical protein